MYDVLGISDSVSSTALGPEDTLVQTGEGVGLPRYKLHTRQTKEEKHILIDCSSKL